MQVVLALEDFFLRSDAISQVNCIETERELKILLKMLLGGCENESVLKSEMSRTQAANPFPITMFAMAAYWRETQEERSLRQKETPIDQDAIISKKKEAPKTTTLASLSSGLTRGFLRLSRMRKRKRIAPSSKGVKTNM